MLASELRFGDDVPVPLTIAGGRTIGFHGSIDRVDELPDGTLVVVDHKTGKRDALAKLSADDPTLGGTPLPAPGLRRRGARRARPPRRARRGRLHVLPTVRARPAGRRRGGRAAASPHDLARVVAGIEAGLFPARAERPGWRMFPGCWYCEPDGLGTATRWAEWERKRHDPQLAPWFGDERRASSG